MKSQGLSPVSIRVIIPATDSLRVFINLNSPKRSCVLLQKRAFRGRRGLGGQGLFRNWKPRLGSEGREERRPEVALGIPVDRFVLKAALGRRVSRQDFLGVRFLSKRNVGFVAVVMSPAAGLLGSTWSSTVL